MLDSEFWPWFWFHMGWAAVIVLWAFIAIVLYDTWRRRKRPHA